jgi:hypothetical protein
LAKALYDFKHFARILFVTRQLSVIDDYARAIDIDPAQY